MWRAVADKAVEVALERYASDKAPASAAEPAAEPPRRCRSQTAARESRSDLA